jgi:imidazole glycerol-phosphate synthase subunit HisH
LRVLVVDYGMGNLASARRGFEEGGADARVSRDPADIAASDAVVVPGVGAFGQAMERLNEGGWSDALRAAAADGKPIMGICLGMQLLADHGTEFGDNPGLGLIPGTVRKIAPAPGERIPHVGWNEVTTANGDALFAGIPEAADFYFVHSFRFETDDPAHVIASAPYGADGAVTAAVRRGRVVGTQFHPEKSSRVGLQLIRNFLAEARG